MSPNYHIDLWVWPIDGGADQARPYVDVLSAHEKSRADRFLNPAHGDAFRIAHGRLRHILGRRLGIAPNAVAFDTGPHGKPSLAGAHNSLSFNLTHSGALAALAVTEGLDLGVDIEEIREVKEDIAERYFSEDEVRQIRTLPGDRQNDAFFRCWTRKEAIVKALGSGLTMPLDKFTVDILADRERGLVRSVDQAAADRWRLAPFMPAAGYHGAVAVLTDGRPIVLTRHE